MDGILVTLTASGMRCPKSGRYESQSAPVEIVEMTEGQAVPLLRGQVAYWKLIAAGPK